MADSIKPGYVVSAIATLIGSILGMILFLAIAVRISHGLKTASEEVVWNLIGRSAIAGWWLGSILCCWLSLRQLNYAKARLTALWVAGLMGVNIGSFLFVPQMVLFTLLPFSFGVGGLARWIVVRQSNR
jgi:hypothetical protein